MNFKLSQKIIIYELRLNQILLSNLPDDRFAPLSKIEKFWIIPGFDGPEMADDRLTAFNHINQTWAFNFYS